MTHHISCNNQHSDSAFVHLKQLSKIDLLLISVFGAGLSILKGWRYGFAGVAGALGIFYLPEVTRKIVANLRSSTMRTVLTHETDCRKMIESLENEEWDWTSQLINRKDPSELTVNTDKVAQVLDYRWRPKDHIKNSLRKKQEEAQNAMTAEKDYENFIFSDEINFRKTGHCYPPTSNYSFWSDQPHLSIINGVEDKDYPHSVALYQGDRKKMEDYCLAFKTDVLIQGRTFKTWIFGILDGHGYYKAAKMVKENFHLAFQNRITLLEKEHPEWDQDQLIWNALKLANVDLTKNYTGADGTAVTIALIIGENLWISHVGNSRAFLTNGQKSGCFACTKDMRPVELPITFVGSSWLPCKECRSSSTMPIWRRGGHIANTSICSSDDQFGLYVGGSIGDRLFPGVSARPSITRYKLNQLLPNTHLILASKGVFSVASTRQAENLCRKYCTPSDPNQMVRVLLASAYNSGSDDNISVAAVKLS